VIFARVAAAFCWVVSVLGAERRARRMGTAPAGTAAVAGPLPSLSETLREIWGDARTRRYAVFLAASAFFAFMQDAVLEPFGGDVFGLSVGETTRFNAYWGLGVLVSMIATYGLTRRRTPDQQVGTTAWGLALLAVPLVFLGVAAVRESLPMVRPVLFLFGIGFGVFTVGGVSLLMAVTTAAQAASYLALWSVIQLISRGLGIAAGGLVRDIVKTATGEVSLAYGTVFMVEAVGLLLCIWLLLRVDVAGFASSHRDPITGEPFGAGID
jgi:BCD family chlorophyll transporter-like MFS transporter